MRVKSETDRDNATNGQFTEDVYRVAQTKSAAIHLVCMHPELGNHGVELRVWSLKLENVGKRTWKTLQKRIVRDPQNPKNDYWSIIY